MTALDLFYGAAGAPTLPEGVRVGHAESVYAMQARLAALSLGLTTRVLAALAGAPAELRETARAALILQVNHQLAHGVGSGERLVQSESRGARSVTYAPGVSLVDVNAAALIADILARYGPATWSAMPSLRPIRGGVGTPGPIVGAAVGPHATGG